MVRSHLKEHGEAGEKQPVHGRDTWTCVTCGHTPPTHPHARVSLVYWLEEDKSHIGKDPVHEESHDGSAEQPSHRDGHKPGHKDVPEEAPVHSLAGADPAHGHHRAHLQEHRCVK